MSSTQIPAAYDPARVIDDLRALADLTGGPEARDGCAGPTSGCARAGSCASGSTSCP